MPFTKDEKIVTKPLGYHHALYDRIETYKKGQKAQPIPDVAEYGDIYSVMMARLGYPKSVRLRRLLEWLFTPIEMDACHALKDLPLENQADNIAEMLDITVDQASDILESCFQKGVLFARDRKTGYGYRFMPRGHMQFHDGSMTNSSLDLKYGPQLFNLWNDWCYHEEGKNDYDRQKRRMDAQEVIGESDTQIGRRIIPAYEAILESPDVDQLQSWEDGREVINCHYRWAMSHCSCRRRVSGGGMTCKRTVDQVCLQFDMAAETVILRHNREVSKEEALAALTQAHRDGLVGSMIGHQTPHFFMLCFCCDCCCHHWAPHITQWGDYHPGQRWKKSRWQVSIDQEKCIACKNPSSGKPRCIHVCQWNAIEMRDTEVNAPGKEPAIKKRAYVEPDKCWGCLSCATICPSKPKAIVAHCVRPTSWVPKEPRFRGKRIEWKARETSEA